MKSHLLSLLALAALTACSGNHDAHKQTAAAAAKPTVRLSLVPQQELVAGQETIVLAKLNTIKDPAVVTADDLETVHTEKFHLLVIDPTLTDYQHIHPHATYTPGLFRFAFTPKLSGYRAWADVTPKATGKQEFAMADLGAHRAGAIDKTPNSEATVERYRFSLSFDKAPQVGEASMGTLRIADSRGNPVQNLQPVMGAFAHIVGFHEDFRTVMHTHPMGDEPTGDHVRGGPELMFHFEPQKAGFVKLFAQVKIGGQDIYAPFGVVVAPHK